MRGSVLKHRLGRGVRALQARLGRLVFERGTLEDTQEHVGLDELGGNPEHTRYEPSPYLQLRRALRGERIGPEHVFIDYGSGKGRIVLLAARRPFGRVMGVEIADELNVVARRNLGAVEHRVRSRHVEFVTANVVEWDPPDDITHAYLYNPFSGSVFDAAIAGLLRSYDRRPRRITLIYANPTQAHRLAATGRIRLLRRTSSPMSRGIFSKQIAIYEVLPIDGSLAQ